MTMIPTFIRGIPCNIEVTAYWPGSDTIQTGWGYGDCIEGDAADVDIQICDRRGRHAPWIERKMTREDWREAEQEALEYMESRHAEEEYDE